MQIYEATGEISQLKDFYTKFKQNSAVLHDDENQAWGIYISAVKKVLQISNYATASSSDSVKEKILLNRVLTQPEKPESVETEKPKISNMLAAYERSDLIHIMKMNRLTLSDSDTAQLEFGGQAKGKSHRITIMVVEDLPRISIERNGEAVYDDTVRSVDDLKKHYGF